MKKILLVLVTTSMFLGCSQNDDGADWYNGGKITGDYATFVIEFTSPQDWDTYAIRYNALENNWLTFSPTKGKAGDNTVTFRVSTNKKLMDSYQIHFDMSDCSFELHFNYEDGGSDISIYDNERGGSRTITSLDISRWTQLDDILTVDCNLPNLKQIWMKHGQETEIEDSWVVKYK